MARSMLYIYDLAHKCPSLTIANGGLFDSFEDRDDINDEMVQLMNDEKKIRALGSVNKTQWLQTCSLSQSQLAQGNHRNEL